MLVQTTDAVLVSAIIESEIKNAEASGAIRRQSVPVPTPGIIAMGMKNGDVCFRDDTEPRVAGWAHPLSKTEAVVLHCWGPSTYGAFVTPWRGLTGAVADFLQAKGFLTMTWVAGNPLGIAGQSLTGATQRTDGTVSVLIAAAKTTLATKN